MAKQYTAAQKTSKTKTASSGKTYLIIGIIIAVIILALVIGIGTLVSKAKNYDRIYPNVFIENIDVGKMTKEEALSAVSSNTNSSDSLCLTINIENESRSINAEQAGLSFSAEDSVNKAYEYGQSLDILSKIKRLTVGGERIDISEGIRVDEDSIKTFLEENFSSYFSAENDSYYKVSGEELVLFKGKDGTRLDTKSLCHEIAEHFVTGDMSPVNAQLAYFTATELDLDALYKDICVPAQNAYYDEATKTIVDGVTGFGFDLESAKAAYISSPQGTKLTFKMELTAPEKDAEVVRAEMFGDVLAEYTSNLENNPKRTNNVNLAASKINGIILAPGETFSFNTTVGERTSEAGYQEAPVYVSGETRGELGGGICQVASTMYVCCLYSNLEIVDRQEHQYLVTYVPYGMDATVYWGSQDFKFKNNKQNPILIETVQEGLTLTVRLLGVKEDDTYVKMTYEILSQNPYEKLTEVDETKPVGYKEVTVTGYTGYTISTTKSIYAGDGTLISSALEETSYYRRRDEITVVGPDAAPDDKPTQQETTDPVTVPDTEPGVDVDIDPSDPRTWTDVENPPDPDAVP